MNSYKNKKSIVLKIVDVITFTFVVGASLLSHNLHPNRKHAVWFSTDGTNITERWSLKNRLNQYISSNGFQEFNKIQKGAS